ncbi:hypothetical protein PAXRUDRAFT_18499 [Paxillus rubicundulus Ve08.2h10]|uniref:DDE-1 domain-containing protein n=1 Tax=Paxillus rubicundulus Ve08.2h10 TaxID=930991 RepID=A0A0D0CXW6_9AGAM|nr:hypothetical protein PAXRUDRAFT_18499 [Paxillus rubicundulus Ve08.2h10]
MPPDCGLADKQHAGLKGKKVQLTYLFTANADGSKKLPPLIIGKAYKPCAFKNKTGEQLGFIYWNNAKAWMMAMIYQEWLLDWDEKLRREGRKILLLQDNFSGHVIPDTLTNIHIKNFEPNLTAHVQPNDQGIIHCFKAHYRAKFIHRSIDLYEAGITLTHVYNIDQLEGMHLTDKAWNENLVRQAEDAVESTLNTLEKTGLLQHTNQMDINKLLNPAVKVHQVFEETDEDIYEAVMDAKRVWEESAKSGEVDVESDAPVEPAPMCNKALQAALLLQKYMRDLDDPFAHKLEMMLGLFGRKMCTATMQNTKDTELTNYFPSKE